MTEQETALRDQAIAVNQKLLDAIMGGDWTTYETLCDKTLTCLEPEAPGQVVIGLDFHKFYFAPSAGGAPKRIQTTMANIEAHVCGDVVVLAYVRLVQVAGGDGSYVTKSTAETRVWKKTASGWKHIHFHRTPLASA